MDVQAYVGKNMAADIVSILDKERLDGKSAGQKVIGIAHDWGTYLLSQLVIWYPERFEKVVFFSVPFGPPGRAMNVDKINAATKKKSGFEQYGYQVFLASDGAGKIIGRNWEKFYHSVFPSDPTYWKTRFAGLGGLKSQLDDSKEAAPLAKYVSEMDKAHHHASFGDDYSAPCRWYVRGIANLGVEEEKKAIEDGRIGRALERFQGDVLMIGGLKDVVCPAAHARSSMNKFVPGGEKGGRLVVRDVDAGHWIMLEKVEETNRILSEFFGEYGNFVKPSL